MKRFVLIGAALLLSACGGDGLGLEGIAGRYFLQTVDGAPLPGILSSNAGVSVEVQSGSIRLNSDASFSTSLSLRIFDADNSLMETSTDVGTYVEDGSSLVFTFSDGSTESGSHSGDRLTMVSDGIALVFEK